MKAWPSFAIYLVFTFLNLSSIFAEDSLEEFQVKRKEIYEFTKEPTLVKVGDKVTIEFTVKDFCDATVAIQNQKGEIIRHLASGVLGNKAPEPFQSNSLSQKLEWDSKNDQGKYVDNIKEISVRVSLGLKPTYEKDLYTSPYKRISTLPSIAVAKEGVYVFEGYARDEVRLFGHNGEYIKTVYPFPASKIESVKGIQWTQYAGRSKVPVKNSTYHQTILTSGDNDDQKTGKMAGTEGKAATAITVQNERIAIAMENLNRLSTDGSTGGFNLKGSVTSFAIQNPGYGEFGRGKIEIGPTSMAFSPDGKTIYMTGYHWLNQYGNFCGSIPAVMKMNYETDDPFTVFAGKSKETEYGNGDDKLNTPTSVDTDSKGNVYVSDFCNDRIQIYSPDGKLLSSIKTNKPAKVQVHKLTGEIFVFSFGVIGIPPAFQIESKIDFYKIPQKISSYSAFPELKEISVDDFPLGKAGNLNQFSQGTSFQIGLDSWSKTPAFWVVAKKFAFTNQDLAWEASSARNAVDPKGWLNGAIRRVEKVEGKWTETDNFGKRVTQQLVRPSPPHWNQQHLLFNPKSKKFYLGEGDSGLYDESFYQLIELDIETGKSQIVILPLNPMEVAFDLDGLIYLRTMNVVSRFNMDTWKEVPFDYGMESDKVGDDGYHTSPVVSALMVPATNAVCFHQSGFDVNMKGDILVACHNRTSMNGSDGYGGASLKGAKSYTGYKPNYYPGRLESSTSVCFHVWDKHGKPKQTDIVPGSPKSDGAYLDERGNIYFQATPPRKINNKELDDGMSSTLFKFKPNKGKFLASGNCPVALPDSETPKRSQDLRGMWAENYEWIYGGVGFGGFNSSDGSGGCACWFTRFKLDYFARSFTPEPMQYGVSIVDSNGNLIVRVGKYGNADSCGPKSKEPLGGDEVGLFHPCFIGVDTDHRLFISDIGNERIVSVKLDYYVNKILPITK